MTPAQGRRGKTCISRKRGHAKRRGRRKKGVRTEGKHVQKRKGETGEGGALNGGGGSLEEKRNRNKKKKG